MSPTESERREVRLAEAAPSILDADQLLFRRKGVIASVGRGPYSHAAKTAWWGRDLFCLEVREWRGGRAVTLESQVKRRPGQIDVFRSNPGNHWVFDRQKSTDVMKQFAGCQYGYWGVLRASFSHLPVVRLLTSANIDDAANDGTPPFCSHACAYADRVGGFDPVRNLADAFTEPSDLARSPFYEYLFTLVP